MNIGVARGHRWLIVGVFFLFGSFAISNSVLAEFRPTPSPKPSRLATYLPELAQSEIFVGDKRTEKSAFEILGKRQILEIVLWLDELEKRELNANGELPQDFFEKNEMPLARELERALVEAHLEKAAGKTKVRIIGAREWSRMDPVFQSKLAEPIRALVYSAKKDRINIHELWIERPSSPQFNLQAWTNEIANHWDQHGIQMGQKLYKKIRFEENPNRSEASTGNFGIVHFLPPPDGNLQLTARAFLKKVFLPPAGNTPRRLIELRKTNLAEDLRIRIANWFKGHSEFFRIYSRDLKETGLSRDVLIYGGYDSALSLMPANVQNSYGEQKISLPTEEPTFVAQKQRLRSRGFRARVTKWLIQHRTFPSVEGATEEERALAREIIAREGSIERMIARFSPFLQRLVKIGEFSGPNGERYYQTTVVQPSGESVVIWKSVPADSSNLPVLWKPQPAWFPPADEVKPATKRRGEVMSKIIQSQTKMNAKPAPLTPEEKTKLLGIDTRSFEQKFKSWVKQRGFHGPSIESDDTDELEFYWECEQRGGFDDLLKFYIRTGKISAVQRKIDIRGVDWISSDKLNPKSCREHIIEEQRARRPN